jgi:hypothetical protein
MTWRNPKNIAKVCQVFFFFFFFWLDWVLAVPQPFFARCPIFSDPIKPCWESNRTCQPDPGRGVKHPIPRVGKGVPGFGIERAPSREGVSALVHRRPHRRPSLSSHYIDLHVNFPASTYMYVKFTCFNFLTQIFEFFFFFWNIRSQPGMIHHPSIPKELEVMDNFNPDEPIPLSPHVTLWGRLCTLIYILMYLLCVLWI